MNQKIRKNVLDFLLLAGAVVVGYFILRKFSFLLFPILLAWLFSEAIRKSFRRLNPLSPTAKRILIVLVLLIFFALLSLVAVLLTERIIRWGSAAASTLPDTFNGILSFCQERVRQLEDLAGRLFHRNLENSVTSHFPELFDAVSKKILASIPTLMGKLVNFVPRFFISLFIFLIFTYYFSCDWDKFSRFIQRYVSTEKLEGIGRVKRRFFRGLTQYSKAYLLLFLITFSQLLLGFVLLKIPGAAGKAFTVAFVDLLPIFGCGTVLIPWAFISLVLGHGTLSFGLFLTYLVILVVRQILEPKIVGSSIGLHPALSLICVLLGLTFFGFAGMILVPLFATCILTPSEE